LNSLEDTKQDSRLRFDETCTYFVDLSLDIFLVRGITPFCPLLGFGVRRTAEFSVKQLKIHAKIQDCESSNVYYYLYKPGKNVRSICISPIVPRTRVPDDSYSSIRWPVPAPHPSTSTNDPPPTSDDLPRTPTWAYTPRSYDFPQPLV
jgi:hypothetical protein